MTRKKEEKKTMGKPTKQAGCLTAIEGLWEFNADGWNVARLLIYGEKSLCAASEEKK